MNEMMRSEMYALLASLWRAAPAGEALAWLRAIEAEPGPLARGLGLVQLAASSRSEQELAEEYQDLFIGLGRGEIVPFASWYLTGSLMELPLAVLRRDLLRLGFERQEGVCEPEDHLAALCEVMAILCAEEHPARNEFFERHLAPWVQACCRDQQAAKSAVFYRAAGALADDFFQQELALRLPFGVPRVAAS
ncbi:TorD/DmsD family molecular chaperone [Aeromonas simiae]|uniref:TorD family cytoplasmic chaperone n=1 Tax=Aeromonas simiae TaxID=218936 RepID=A0A5J6WWN2_9GAMM|nr:molecular chaperone TorD family protein [Aeromonas simiae]QFI54153.1 TorD family cytoplasmic chaperone [Aeromonas simiae]